MTGARTSPAAIENTATNKKDEQPMSPSSPAKLQSILKAASPKPSVVRVRRRDGSFTPPVTLAHQNKPTQKQVTFNKSPAGETKSSTPIENSFPSFAKSREELIPSPTRHTFSQISGALKLQRSQSDNTPRNNYNLVLAQRTRSDNTRDKQQTPRSFQQNVPSAALPAPTAINVNALAAQFPGRAIQVITILPQETQQKPRLLFNPKTGSFDPVQPSPSKQHRRLG